MSPLKRISQKKLVAIRTSVYQDEDRYKYAGNCIVTAAQAQLDDDRKKLKEKVRKIFEEIENIISWGEYEELADGEKVRDGHIMSEPWQRLKQEVNNGRE